MSILYITYDGLLEPLGKSQVLAYQEKLSKDFEIIILSYEKPSDLINHKLVSSVKNRISKTSLKWIARKYHKSPSILATFYDLFIGSIHCLFLIWRYKIKIVHARSYPPSLIALFCKKIFGTKFIFDMRGFWADERVDGDIWKKDDFIYKIAKSLEKSFILHADHIVSLTNAAVKEINRFSYTNEKSLSFSIIPTCVDLVKFSERENSQSPNEFTLGYLGTVGTWYLFDETVKAFKYCLEINPISKILIINKNEHQFIKEVLKKNNIPLSSAEIISADHDDIPKILHRMSGAVFFLKPYFSKQAAAPTKLGELLASGIPSLTNEGVGDMAKILRDTNTGITIENFSDFSIKNGVIDLMELVQQKDIIMRCRKAGESNFSLNDGIEKYKNIYKNLLK